jgi:lysophospholipase L1-like esterase
MQDVNAAEKSRRVWVGNAGISGANTVNHLVLMQWLPGVLHVDMMIFLIGVNDLSSSLAFEGATTQAVLEQQAGYQGDLPHGVHWRSNKVYPYYRRLKFVLLLHQAGQKLRQRLHRAGDRPASRFDIAIGPVDLVDRKKRADAKIVPLPDLSTGLKEYRSRIIAMAKQCRDLQVRCLFLTQPTMWRGDLSPEEQSLLWLGYAGPFRNPRGYIAAGELERAMDMYNRTLLDVCGQSGLECFDVAATIPKDTSAYFDDAHFNENGARLMAQNLERYLLARPPFQAR